MENYGKDLTYKIYEMYLNENIGFNPLCKLCKEYAKSKNKELLNGPVPIFHIGNNYHKQEIKILFVGRVAYGWDELKELWGKLKLSELKNEMSDIVEDRIKDLFFNERRYHEDDGKLKFFTYIQKACEMIFGNDIDGFNNIAITNYVHCNTDSISDNLPQKVRNYCVDKNENGFLFKEIDILNPTHIIILTTDWKYNRYTYNINIAKKFPHPSSRSENIGKGGFAKAVKEFVMK